MNNHETDCCKKSFLVLGKGLKGNPGKIGEVFSADHNLFPDSCADCFLNRDGKVHGISGVFDADGGVKKGNCISEWTGVIDLNDINMISYYENYISIP